VGILEKIVQSLTAKKIGTNIKELQAQYNAQVDVLAQLQVKIQRLLTQQQQQQQQQQKRPTADSNTILTTLSKLQRDFDRIRQRVAALEDGVERFQKLQEQQKQNNSTAANQQNSMNGRAGGEAEQDYQQQIQLQLQQDVRLRIIDRALSDTAVARPTLLFYPMLCVDAYVLSSLATCCQFVALN